MALSGGVGKGIALLVGVGFTVTCVYAFKVSQRRGFAGEAEREARLELVAFAGKMARCAVGQGLPKTSARVPAKLADVSAKTYTSKPEDWKDQAFECADYQLTGAQHLQYRWYKNSPEYGSVEARGDTDGNGLPDTWYEIRVICSKPRTCEAVNYVSTVDENGLREPPSILRWFGRSKAFMGEPPSLSADDEVAPSAPAPAPLPEASAKPLEEVKPGAPTPLNTLYFDAERRAASKLAGAVLLELEYKGARERLGDPVRGLSARGFYGHPDAKGVVAAGAEVVSVSYDQAGFKETLTKAPRELHAVGFAECLPEKLILALEPPAAITMTLAWSKKDARAVWTTQGGKAPPSSYSADTCAKAK